MPETTPQAMAEPLIEPFLSITARIPFNGSSLVLFLSSPFVPDSLEGLWRLIEAMLVVTYGEEVISDVVPLFWEFKVEDGASVCSGGSTEGTKIAYELFRQQIEKRVEEKAEEMKKTFALLSEGFVEGEVQISFL